MTPITDNGMNTTLNIGVLKDISSNIGIQQIIIGFILIHIPIMLIVGMVIIYFLIKNKITFF
jgi:hypothetical protein